MELTYAFATDDGKTLKKNDHFGNAGYYAVYRISSERDKFIEQRDNIIVKENDDKHGDPSKARAVSSVLKGLDVLVSRMFGPNIKRMMKKFVCIIIRTDSIEEAIKAVKLNMNKITEEYRKKDDREVLILNS